MKVIQNIGHYIHNINREEFHFLRPDALYLFIPLAFIFILLLVGNKSNNKWQKLIAPHLRPFMFSKGSPWAIMWPLLSFVIASSLSILGVAGPT